MKAQTCAEFLGWQERPHNQRPYALWNLRIDIPGHCAGSTVITATLERAGYHMIEPPLPEDKDVQIGQTYE